MKWCEWIEWLWFYHYLIWLLSFWLFIFLQSGTMPQIARCMWPTWGPWVLLAPGGPHVGPTNLAIRDDVWGVRSSSFQSSSILYTTIINNASLQELVMQGLEEKLENHVTNVKGTLGIHTLNISLSLLNILLSMSNASVILTSLSKTDVKYL